MLLQSARALGRHNKLSTSESPKPRSRFSATYFANLIDELGAEHRSIIQKSSVASFVELYKMGMNAASPLSLFVFYMYPNDHNMFPFLSSEPFYESPAAISFCSQQTHSQHSRLKEQSRAESRK